MQNNKVLKVVVKNKDGVILNQELEAITSYNERGVFDVLPMHENFISIIKDKIITHEKGGKKTEINIDRGVLKVIDNNVNIYLGL